MAGIERGAQNRPSPVLLNAKMNRHSRYYRVVGEKHSFGGCSFSGRITVDSWCVFANRKWISESSGDLLLYVGLILHVNLRLLASRRFFCAVWPDLGCGDVVIVDFLDDELSSSVDVFVGCVVGAISIHARENADSSGTRLKPRIMATSGCRVNRGITLVLVRIVQYRIGYWLVINKREGLHTHSIREASALLILRQPFTVSLELLFADLASCVTALESFYRGIITPGRSVTSLQCPG